MPTSLQDLIDAYGYAVVLIGTFLEGVTVLILGGVAARLRYLRLEWVIPAASAATMLGGQSGLCSGVHMTGGSTWGSGATADDHID